MNAAPRDWLLVVAAGLCGAIGVGLAAAAAHLEGGSLGTAADFALFHAPALLAIGLVGTTAAMRAAGWLLLAGLMLFAGDLVTRQLTGAGLFAMAAPIGGIALICGWLLVAIGAAMARFGR